MVISLFEVYFFVREHSLVKEEFKHQKAQKTFSELRVRIELTTLRVLVRTL